MAKVFSMTEPEMRNHLRQHKEHMLAVCRLKEMPTKVFMPTPLAAFEKRSVFKHCKEAPVSKKKLRTRSKNPEQTDRLQSPNKDCLQSEGAF